MNKKHKILIFGGSLAVLLIVAEVTLRLVWGFGKMPLYAASDKYEYMALPNQSGVRLGDIITMHLVCEVMKLILTRSISWAWATL